MKPIMSLSQSMMSYTLAIMVIFAYAVSAASEHWSDDKIIGVSIGSAFGFFMLLAILILIAYAVHLLKKYH
tara:strand:- start:177 stop:389 length:213 start_codon:yes stop_codon:yes gene_type:complete